MIDPLGAVLAGGSGRRIGGAKATIELAGRPLIAYPLAALAEVLGEVVVVAKPGTALPELAVEVWVEPPEPRHPAVGIACALRRAAGRAVLVCACDMPLLDPETVRRLAHAEAGGAPAVVASVGGKLEPLLGRYEPSALGALAGASGSMRALAASMGAVALECDERVTYNVNSPQDLGRVREILCERG